MGTYSKIKFSSLLSLSKWYGIIQLGRSVKNLKIQMEEMAHYEENFDEMYKSFMIYNRAKNLTKATLDYYEYNIQNFLEWLETERSYKHSGELQQLDIYEYKQLLLDEPVARTTVNNRLRAVRTFINFGISENYVDEDLKLDEVKTQGTVKETYTDHELRKLLKKPDLESTRFPNYRTWVAVNFLLATGVRLGTIVNIRVSDIDFVNRLISLNTTKSKKPQLIPMSNNLSKVLREYLKYRDGSNRDFLFCTESGNHLSKSGFISSIKRYHKRRGVNRHSVHLYRHTFAKLAIKNGVDPLRLQKLLGHSTLKITEMYTKLFGTDLQEGFNDYNPLDNLRR